jgi:diacylglycerol kinase family enzyme
MPWSVAVPARLGSRRSAAAARAAEGLGTVETAVERTSLGSLVAEALAEGADGVAIAGGDADLAALAGAVLAADAAESLRLGLLPIGRRSSLLRMFGLPHRSGAGDHLRGAGEYRCDLIRITTSAGSRLVAAWAGLGIAASKAGRLRRRGHAAEVTARTPNRTLVHRAHGALLANSQFWGDLNPAPRAMLVDGRFDLQLLLARRSRALLTAMETGRHTGRPDVVRTAVSGLALTSDRPWRVTADGEDAGETPLEAVALERAIRLAI